MGAKKAWFVLGVLVLLVASLGLSPTYYFTWVDELGTQLLWSDAEAVLTIRTRHTGWRGGFLGMVWQGFRNAAGANTDVTESLESVEVVRFDCNGFHRTTLRDVQVSRFVPNADRLLAPVDGELARWTGDGFAPASPADLDYFRNAAIPLGNYDGVRGWSNRVNLMYWGQTDARHKITVAGHSVEIRVQAPSGFRKKELSVAVDGAPQASWTMASERTAFSAADYKALFISNGQ